MQVARAKATPWLSVVIPSFRGEEWIATALDSIAMQTDEGIEVLLVDGGPTAAATDIARNYADRLHLRIFERPDLKNWHSKTNFAVGAAEAPHICWLGVDDVWLPGRAQAVRQWTKESPDLPLHLGASMFIDRHGRSIGRWNCPLPSLAELPPSLTIRRLLVQNFVAAPAPVFRRDAWLRCGGLDEALWYTADWDVWLKLAAAGNSRYHDIATVGFRVHSGAQTITGSRDPSDFRRQMQAVVQRHLVPTMVDARPLGRLSRASVEVNLAIAALANGDKSYISSAVWSVLRLGPFGIRRYLRDSRLWERVLPRVRARLAGDLG